ncbi:winged helix DNA-binding protein [Parahaliea maris]|nr:winged helix DNA-binding protein [Parahaliea maris]
MTNENENYMSSSELAAELTRVELAIIRTIEAFSRWSTVLQKSASGSPLSYRSVALLHSIRMCGGAQNLSELLMFLNRNDVSTLQYSLKKLEQDDLIERVTGSSKREAGYRLTDKGMEATSEYARLREEILIRLLDDLKDFDTALKRSAGTIERMTAVYDQATQTVMNRKISARQ